MKPGRYKLHDGSSILVGTTRYHRNGVGGSGFWAVRFKYDGESFIGLVVGGDEAYRGAEVLVIEPRELSRTMRGHDWFGPALIRAVKNRRKNGFGWEPELDVERV